MCDFVWTNNCVDFHVGFIKKKEEIEESFIELKTIKSSVKTKIYSHNSNEVDLRF